MSLGILLRVTVALMLDSEYNTAAARSDDHNTELHEVFTSEAICAAQRVQRPGNISEWNDEHLT